MHLGERKGTMSSSETKQDVQELTVVPIEKQPKEVGYLMALLSRWLN